MQMDVEPTKTAKTVRGLHLDARPPRERRFVHHDAAGCAQHVMDQNLFAMRRDSNPRDISSKVSPSPPHLSEPHGDGHISWMGCSPNQTPTVRYDLYHASRR